MKYPYENAVQAILYGHSYAMRLKLRLEDPVADDGSISSYDLVRSIIDCLSSAIENLTDKPKASDDKFSHLSSRDVSPSPPLMSNSKKRKISNTSTNESWRDDSPNPIYYDGFLWRKYGEKYIKNADHQRSYYKCSYNIDHQCGARKHEEKVKDNPPVYRTTYFGHHTCQINHNQDALFTTVLDPVDDSKSARIIQFGKDLTVKNKVKNKEDFTEEEAMDKKTNDIDQECQDVMEENISSVSSSCPVVSSSGSEDSKYNSELLWDDLGWCDPYDQFDFGLC